jgi:hypothetical protein
MTVTRWSTVSPKNVAYFYSAGAEVAAGSYLAGVADSLPSYYCPPSGDIFCKESCGSVSGQLVVNSERGITSPVPECEGPEPPAHQHISGHHKAVAHTHSFKLPLEDAVRLAASSWQSEVTQRPFLQSNTPWGTVSWQRIRPLFRPDGILARHTSVTTMTTELILPWPRKRLPNASQ